MLTAPEDRYAPERKARRTPTLVPERVLRRNVSQDFAAPVEEGDGGYHRRRRAGLRLTFQAGVPRSVWGRVATGLSILLGAGMLVGFGLLVEQWVLHDSRFLLAGQPAIEIDGNQHMSRRQLLEAFRGDAEHNIFLVPLEQRQAALEQMPWVKRATVMRLLPNHLRVQIAERTPVAFVRNGSQVGLVDAEGELLDGPQGGATDGAEQTQYSFPVVTGIVRGDPISTREARMKIYEGFMADLDASGEKITGKLSEVDLSDPEDVRALIPDNGAEVLVHFGDASFLDRYHKYEQHLPEWRSQYPKLASVDMRYERQVVLEMQPGTSVPIAAEAGSGPDVASPPKTSPAGRGGSVTPGGRALPGAPAGTARDASRPRGAKRTVAHAAGTTARPQVVGSWTKDGKYHAPPPGGRQ